jgi:hypothetical protein
MLSGDIGIAVAYCTASGADRLYAASQRHGFSPCILIIRRFHPAPRHQPGVLFAEKLGWGLRS